MADIVLRDHTGSPIEYPGVDIIRVAGVDGEARSFGAYDPEVLTPDKLLEGVSVGDVTGSVIIPETLENVPVTLDFSGGDQTITAPDGAVVKSAIIQKPETLIPENIAKDVEIAGVVGVAGVASSPEGPIFDYTTDGLEDVRFYDIDGTIVYRCSVEEAGQLTALPAPPLHDGFLFQEWNHTLDEVVSAEHPLDVGANYVTADGKTVLTVKVLTNTTNAASGTVTMTFYQSVDNGVEISIDGGAAKTVSGTGQVSISIGNFSTDVGTSKEVTFTAAKGCAFYVVNFSSIKYNSYLSYTPNIGTAKIGYGYDLSNTMSLNNVINIPVGMTSVTNSARIGAKYFRIPRSVTEISNRPHYANCYMLSLPRNVNVTYTSLANYVYADRIIFPETLTTTQNLANFFGKYVYFPDGLSTVRVDGGNLLKVRLPAQPFKLSGVSHTRMSKFTVPANATINMSASSPSAYDGLFSECYNLREIVFDGCTVADAALNKNIAYKCPFLTKIRFPQGVTSISGYIASYCAAEVLVIPEGVETVSLSNLMSSSVQQTNQSLAVIVLPSTLTSMTGVSYSSGFYGDNLCAIVYLSADPPNLHFNSTNDPWNCYVKDEIVESMKKAYATYKDRIKPLSELPSGTKELIKKEYGVIID